MSRQNAGSATFRPSTTGRPPQHRGRRVARLVVLGAALVAFAPAALHTPDAHAAVHKDDDLGFKLTVPRKWTKLPLAANSQWIVAKFASNREYEYSDPKAGGWATVRPKIEVVVIPHAVRDRDSAKVKKTDEGVEVTREAPWKTIREYVDKTSRGLGGFHFSSEEEDEIDGVKVTKYELTVDKLVTGERRVYAWAFEGKDAEWGVLCDIFARDEKKLRPEIFKSFSSFRLYQRTGSLPNEAITGETITIDDPEKKETRTPDEVARDREAAVDRFLDRTEKDLPKGWFVRKSKHFVAVSHSDKKHTDDVLDHCEALRKWFDDSLSWIGEGYVGRVVVRICADRTEYNSYMESRGWNSDAPEIVTYKDRDGYTDGVLHSLNSRLWDAWIKDRNKRLRWGAPQWFDSGISSLVQDARSKRKKIVFKPWEGDKVELKKAMKEDRLLPVQAFFEKTSEDVWSDYQTMTVQMRYFVDFLVNGRAAKSKRFSEVLPQYFAALSQVLAEEEEREKEERGTPDKEPESEEEEDRMYRERQQAWKKREKDQLKAVFDRVFGDWSRKDWQKLDSLYRKDID